MLWWKRSDGRLVRGLPNTRRVMPYMIKGRNEAAVYFEYDLSLTKADAFIRDWNHANPGLRIDVFHLALWAMRACIEHTPSVNRFVIGGRLYQREGIWFSYAVKQKLETGAPLVVVKRRFDTDESFAAMVQGMAEEQARALHETGAVDRELGLLMAFPGVVRRVIMRALRGLDAFGLLPRGFIEKDPMYSTVFWANMASLGMPAVYHHLYEYGSAGIFASVGRPVAEPGSPTSGPDRRRVMTMRFTFDERTEDGLATWFALRRLKQVVEDPTGVGGITLGPVAAGAVDPVGDADRSEAAVDS